MKFFLKLYARAELPVFFIIASKVFCYIPHLSEMHLLDLVILCPSVDVVWIHFLRPTILSIRLKMVF